MKYNAIKYLATKFNTFVFTLVYQEKYMIEFVIYLDLKGSDLIQKYFL